MSRYAEETKRSSLRDRDRMIWRAIRKRLNSNLSQGTSEGPTLGAILSSRPVHNSDKLCEPLDIGMVYRARSQFGVYRGIF